MKIFSLIIGYFKKLTELFVGKKHSLPVPKPVEKSGGGVVEPIPSNPIKVPIPIDNKRSPTIDLDKIEKEIQKLEEKLKFIRLRKEKIKKEIETLKSIKDTKQPSVITYPKRRSPSSILPNNAIEEIVELLNEVSILKLYIHKEEHRRKKEDKKVEEIRESTEKLKIKLNPFQPINNILEAIEKEIVNLRSIDRIVEVRKDLEKLKEERNQKIRELEALLEKKSDWQDFRNVLEENRVAMLYHFTDRENIESIKKYEGLFAWKYCEDVGIHIPRPGGNRPSREFDLEKKKEYYVRLAFNKEHPMLYVAQKDGRIKDPVWLEVAIEVAYFKDTEFSDINATANAARIGKDLQFLKNVRFDILRKAESIKHYNLSDNEKPYNQAEVLAKIWVPIKYIKNIHQF